jgi:hypothetical protein
MEILDTPHPCVFSARSLQVIPLSRAAGGGSHHLVAWIGYFGTRDGDGDLQTCMAVTRVADRIYDLSLG